jgi:uncharacterized membrane protein YeaQ/YmgE (transglycosylase-associated protein family)
MVQDFLIWIAAGLATALLVAARVPARHSYIVDAILGILGGVVVGLALHAAPRYSLNDSVVDALTAVMGAGLLLFTVRWLDRPRRGFH